MTRITKNIDVRIDDYEVELELDADDLESFDSDDLWTALCNVATTSELADFITDDDALVEKIVEGMSEDELREHIDFDKLVAEHLDAISTDEQKMMLVKWIGDDGHPSLREFAREQLGGAPLSIAALCNDMEPLYALLSSLTNVQKRSCINHLSAITPDAQGAPIDVLMASLRNPNGVTVHDVVAALVKHYGAALVIGHAVGALEASCKPKDAQS